VISLADAIKSTGVPIPKGVLYAPGGWGKTTLAAGMPSPVFLWSEQGRGGLQGLNSLSPHVDRELPPEQWDLTLHSWSELLESINALADTGAHDYKTVVIDTLDVFLELGEQHVCQQQGVANLEDLEWGAGMKTHMPMLLRDLLTARLDVLRNRGMAVMVLVHDNVARMAPPNGKPYNKYSLQMPLRLADMTHDWGDFVFRGDFVAHEVSDGKHFGQDQTRMTGTGQRYILTEERPFAKAKNRYGMAPEILIPHPTEGSGWSAITAAIQQGIQGGPPANQQPAPPAETKNEASEED